MATDINPAMVEMARKSRGLTQTEVADKVGCSQGTISKMEQGLYALDDDDLKALSAALGYPVTFFRQRGDLYTPGIRYNRARKQLSKTVRDQIDAISNIHAYVISELLDAIEIVSDRGIPDYRVDEDGFDSPQEVARALREYWQMPSGPVDNLTALIERAGGIVIHLDVNTKKFDGVYYPFPNLPHIIFLNKNFSADRLRFTLAHELGHVVMHQLPKDVKEMEEETNEFAAEFMMPAEEIKNQLYNLSLEKLARLKKYWKMSMGSILVRAERLGTITKRQYRYLWSKMGKAGYKKNEPVTVPFEEPKVRNQLVEYHMSDLGYTLSELCDAMHISEEDFQSTYYKRISNLKLVKLDSRELAG